MRVRQGNPHERKTKDYGPFLALNGSPQMSKLDIAALQRAHEGLQRGGMLRRR